MTPNKALPLRTGPALAVYALAGPLVGMAAVLAIDIVLGGDANFMRTPSEVVMTAYVVGVLPALATGGLVIWLARRPRRAAALIAISAAVGALIAGLPLGHWIGPEFFLIMGAVGLAAGLACGAIAVLCLRRKA